MNPHAFLRSRASRLIQRIVCLMAALSLPLTFAAGPPKHLEFSISRAANPGGKGTYTGKVNFDRTAVDMPFEVNWTLSNGTLKGWAVPFPESEYIAVGYGKDLGGVAIYKRQADGSSDARFIIVGADAKIGSYGIKRGEERGKYVYKDGTPGTIQIDKEGDTRGFNIQFSSSAGTWKAIGVADGDFLAAASSTGGTDVGVLIYKKTGAGASGWWRYANAPGIGEEDLEIQMMDGESMVVPAAASAPAATPALADEVKELAAQLRGNAKLLMELKPSEAQISAITASPADAAKLNAYVEKLFGSLPPEGLNAKPEQTQILVSTGEDLAGGYQQQASHWKKDIAIYGFEFVVPGETAGMSFDGLMKLDGKWIMVPKMWRAFAK